MEKRTSVCSGRVVGLGALALLVASVQAVPLAMAAERGRTAPTHQVIACYFHRTQRCPTCKKISEYIEEAVRSGFAVQIKQGNVNMAMVDFQDPRNE